MVKYHRRKVRQPRHLTSSSSESSSSSSTSKSSSSTSDSSSSNSSSSCSEVKKPTPRATIVVPSSLSRYHKSRVITAAEYDPHDGAWVYSTTDKAVHNKNKATAAVATRRSFTKSWTTYCRAHEQSSVQDSKLRWLDCTCSFFCNCLFGAAPFQLACLLLLCALAMRRDAAQSSLPTDGDKEDARQPKHLPHLKDSELLGGGSPT